MYICAVYIMFVASLVANGPVSRFKQASDVYDIDVWFNRLGGDSANSF